MALLKKEIAYLNAQSQEAYDLLKTLAVIPAPSGKEERRANFCANWLKQQGAENVEIDEQKNVILEFNCTKTNPVRLFVAHSDVVFPDETPFSLREEYGKLYCPGVGDDTANIVAMLIGAKYLLTHPVYLGDTGIVISVNASEEGLGNLRGTKALMERYGARVSEFVSFDSWNGEVVDNCVGSHRYRVEIRTEGGHSFEKFGNHNAIHKMASLIMDLYNITIPPMGHSTLNVGIISGGTSVNTIAQQAEILYEYRSDDREALALMEKQFQDIVTGYKTKGISVDVARIGERPCKGDVDDARQNGLVERAEAVTKAHLGKEPRRKLGSTDCNIPLSMGIPAVAVGCFNGNGAHTREEYVEIESLQPGLRIALDMLMGNRLIN